MPELRIGGTPIEDVRIGSTQIQKVYAGSSLIWSAYTPITEVIVSGDTSFFWPNKATTLTASANGSNSASYSWTKLSGSAFLTITSGSNSASVVIGTSRSDSGFTSDSAVFRCTATDGTSSAYADVTVTSNGLS